MKPNWIEPGALSMHFLMELWPFFSPMTTAHAQLVNSVPWAQSRCKVNLTQTGRDRLEFLSQSSPSTQGLPTCDFLHTSHVLCYCVMYGSSPLPTFPTFAELCGSGAHVHMHIDAMHCTCTCIKFISAVLLSYPNAQERLQTSRN